MRAALLFLVLLGCSPEPEAPRAAAEAVPSVARSVVVLNGGFSGPTLFYVRVGRPGDSAARCWAISDNSSGSLAMQPIDCGATGVPR